MGILEGIGLTERFRKGKHLTRRLIDGPVSTKCSIFKVTERLFHHSSANHPSARPCPNSNIHAQSEALLLDACHPTSNQTANWLPGIKVIDNLNRIPKGEPIGQFINGVQQGIWAVFWNCHNTGSNASYEIIKQTCGSPATLVEAGADENMYYTLKWSLQVHAISFNAERSCNHQGGFLMTGKEGSVSTKCSIFKVTERLFHHSSANHPSARPCPNSNIHAQSEALLLDACHPTSNQTANWLPGIKVIDNLNRIPKGEPIGQFINGVQQGIWAVFWNCHNTGSNASYEIIKQTCGSPATLVEAGADENMYYTLKW